MIHTRQIVANTSTLVVLIGPFPRGSAGTCMIGKLNYYLGARAFEDGRTSARYMGVDFCKDPSSICRGHYVDDETNAEIRWLVGMLYWINKIQAYNADGWNYLEKLHEFVDGGMQDFTFVDDVSRIITRGCHDTSCGAPVSSLERRGSFERIVSYFEQAQKGTHEGEQFISHENYYLTQFPSTKPTIMHASMSSTSPSSTKPAPMITSMSSNAPSLVKPTNILASMPPSTTPTVSEDGSLDRDITFSPVSSSSGSAVSDENYKLTEEELAQRLNFANNYCASNPADIKAKCATSLRTCNIGDPPCAEGLACYGNVPCINTLSDVVPETVDVSADIPPESDSSFGAIFCKGMCLRTLTVNECVSLGGTVLSLPACYDVAVGGLCDSEGECTGGAGYISNCPQERDIFVTLSVDQCGAPTTDSPSVSPMTDSSMNDSDATQNIDQINAGAWWLLDTSCSTRRSFAMRMLILLGVICFVNS